MTRMDKVSVNPYRPHSLLYIVWFRWWWFSPVRFGTSHCWDSAYLSLALLKPDCVLTLAPFLIVLT